MRKLDPHPLADIFPLMEGEPLADLTTDIQKHGLFETIVLFEDKILDGRNRYAACLRADVVPRFQNFQGSYEGAATYVWSHNVQRRHLTPGQTAAAGIELDELVQSFRDKTPLGRPSKISAPGRSLLPEPSPGKVTEQIARTIGVGTKTVERVVRVKKEDPDLFEKIKEGKVTPKAAENTLIERQVKANIAKVVAAKPAPPEPEPDLRSEEEVASSRRIVGAMIALDNAVKAMEQLTDEDIARDDFPAWPSVLEPAMRLAELIPRLGAKK